MDWITNNPGLFIFYFVLICIFTFLLINSKKSRQKYLDKVTSRNQMSLCATCGNEYHDNAYYAVHKVNYCPSCFERMFYQIKVGGGFMAVLTLVASVILVTFTIMDLINGNFKHNYKWQFQKLVYLFLFSFLIFRLWHDYIELKKAKEEYQRRAGPSEE